MRARSLCVFCGSMVGNNPSYAQKAKELGHLLAENEIDLVYGGASIGVMGALAESTLASGGDVYGVMPKFLSDREVAHKKLTKLFITNSMHDRKALMANLSDGFVALPGGYGTLEELFEAITWSQLKMHKKPVMILNSDGFYDPLIQFIEHTIRSGFIKESCRDILKVCNEPEEIIDYFNSFGKTVE